MKFFHALWVLALLCVAPLAWAEEPDHAIHEELRGVLRKGRILMGARVLVVGSGGVGSAIVASLAKAGVAEIAIFDADAAAMNRLAERLRAHYPALKIEIGSRDPADCDVVVNATPLGMKDDDPLPMDVARLSASTGSVERTTMRPT